MSGRLNFEYGFSTNAKKKLDNETPMRLYVLGDFSGSTNEREPSPKHVITKIDIDSFDQVMARLSPSVTLPSGHILHFNELEDFHPDELFQQTVFTNLRRLKQSLSRPETADSAADEIMSSFGLHDKASEASDSVTPLLTAQYLI